MALIPLFEAKTYLRVDSGDEDALIGILLSSAERRMCSKDVGRLTDDQWEAVNAADRDAERDHTDEEAGGSARAAVWQFCMRWAICRTPGTKRTISS